jgi:Flp pilus assembly protein TadG
MVELALVLPVVLLLVLGIVDFGRVFNAYIVITNASREGAMYGSICPPGGRDSSTCPWGGVDAENAIKAEVIHEAAGSGITIDPARIVVTSTGTTPGTPVTVRVEYPFSAVTSEIGSFFAGSLMLRAQTIMVIK